MNTDNTTRLHNEIDDLRRLLADARKNLHGTLLLDHDTVRTSPVLFSLLALVLRSAGMNVTVMGPVNGESTVTKLGVPLTSYTIGTDQNEKYKIAADLLTHGPVIWVDLELGNWKGPNVNSIPGLTILNWAAVATQHGFPPQKAMSA